MTAAQLDPSTSSGVSGSRKTHLTGSRPDLRVPMRISQDVRRYAEERGLDDADALQAGMREKAAEYVEQGGRIYLPLAD
jgi:hypothetical protein